MKNLNEKAKAYRLPETTTPEELETNWSRVLTFGNRILLAGYFYQGRGQDSYFAAVYEFTGAGCTCEDEIRLAAVSDGFFPDDGHAIQWAINHAE